MLKGIIGNILSGNADKLVESAGNLIDKVVTNEEERGALKNEFLKQIQDYELKYQEQLTERLKIDMMSDSWLSKNIRPMVLIFILIVYSAFSVMDGNITSFNINQAYVELLGQWGIIVMSFYFGSRMIEKTTDLIGKYDLRRNPNKKQQI